MFQITAAKILGRVGAHIFSGKKLIVCILKGISPFKMHKIIFFPENLKKSRFYQLKAGTVYPKCRYSIVYLAELLNTL